MSRLFGEFVETSVYAQLVPLASDDVLWPVCSILAASLLLRRRSPIVKLAGEIAQMHGRLDEMIADVDEEASEEAGAPGVAGENSEETTDDGGGESSDGLEGSVATSLGSLSKIHQRLRAREEEREKEREKELMRAREEALERKRNLERQLRLEEERRLEAGGDAQEGGVREEGGEEGEMGERKYPPVLKVHFSPDDMERDDSVFRIKTGGEAAASGDGSAESMFERAPSLWMEQEMAGGGGGEATDARDLMDLPDVLVEAGRVLNGGAWNAGDTPASDRWGASGGLGGGDEVRVRRAGAVQTSVVSNFLNIQHFGGGRSLRRSQRSLPWGTMGELARGYERKRRVETRIDTLCN